MLWLQSTVFFGLSQKSRLSGSGGRMTPASADSPQTDREWLTRVEMKLDVALNTLKGPDGNGGLCKDVTQLQRDRWYLAGSIGLLIVLVGAGRLIEILYVVPHK